MWTIYSIGDFNLLLEILNAIAALSAPGGALGMSLLIGTGFVIGIFLIMFRAIISGRLELQYLLIGWIGYMLLFGVRVETTNVEDVYTGTSVPVANLPIGIAAVGGIVSGLGNQLTIAFETVFSMPTLTGNGYLDALNMMMSIRGQGAGPANSIATGGTPSRNGDLEKTIVNYIKDCVIYDIEMGLPGQEVTMESLQSARDLWAAMRIDSSIWTTVTFIPGADPPNGDTRTCSAAYAALDNYLYQNFLPEWNAYLGELMGIPDPRARIDFALGALAAGSANAQTYMLNAFVSDLVRQADIGRAAEMGATTAVLLKSQAMEQRRVQWSTEQSLFMEVARPLMAFVESFSYAISPIMAFLVTLGPLGISLLGKYLLVMIWIQLWSPVLAVCNFYIHMTAAAKLSGLQTMTEVSSMRGLESVYTEVASYLATGGMLAAATPVISLMILSGSMYAFTSLARRMQGADHVDEKLAAPDMRNAPTLSNIEPRYKYDEAGGWRDSGYERIATGMNFSERGSIDTRSAKEVAWESQRTFMDTFGRLVSHKWGTSEDGSHGEMIRNLTEAKDGRANQVVRSFVDKHTTGFTLSEKQTDAIVGTITAGLGGRLGTNNEHFNIGANGGLEISGMEGLTSERQQQIQKMAEDAITSNASLYSAFAKGLAHDVTDKLDENHFDAKDASKVSELRRSAADVVSQSERYIKIEGANKAIGTDFSITPLDFSKGVNDMDKKNGNDDNRADLERIFQKYEGEGIRDKYNMYQNSSLQMERIPTGLRDVASKGLALFNHSAEARADMAGFIAKNLGYGNLNALDYGDGNESGNSNRYIDANNKTGSETRKTVEAGLNEKDKLDVTAESQARRNAVDSRRGDREKALKEPDEQLKSFEQKAVAKQDTILNQGIMDVYNRTKPEVDKWLEEQAKEVFATPNGMAETIPNLLEKGGLKWNADTAGDDHEEREVDRLKENGEWDKMGFWERREFRATKNEEGENAYAQAHYEHRKQEAAQYVNPDEAEYYARSRDIFIGDKDDENDLRLAQLEERISEPHRLAALKRAVTEDNPEYLRALGESDITSPIWQSRFRNPDENVPQWKPPEQGKDE